MTEISKTADKALAILVELSDGEPVSPQRLAQRMGINRTVTQRLLTTLLARGFVRRDDGQYVMAPRMRTLADAVLPAVRAAVGPPLGALAAKTGETVVFQIPDGDDVVVLAEEYTPRPVAIQVRHEIGSKSPITVSASGLAILAASPAAVADRVLKGDPAEAEIRARLDEARESGFAITRGDLQAGVTGLATAVVTREGVAGSVAVLVPSTRSAELDGYRHELRRCAKRIETALAR